MKRTRHRFPRGDRLGRVLVLALAVALAALLALVAVALADDTEVGGNVGSVKALTNTDIRMESETVQAILYSRFAEYKVDFHFVNNGPQQQVTLGFPFPAPTGEGDMVPPAGFRAWQDGKPLAVTVVEGKDGPNPTSFYEHTVDFPPGKTTVTVDYLASPTWSVGDVLTSDAVQTGAVKVTPPATYAGEPAYSHEYEYTLHTGANWAGTIGNAVLRYTRSDDFVGWGVPDAIAVETHYDREFAEDDEDSRVALRRDTLLGAYEQPAPNVYQWVFRDLEPTTTAYGFSASDIGLAYLAPPTVALDNQPNTHAVPKVTASSTLKLDNFEYPAEQITDGLPATAWAENSPGTGIGEWVDFAWPSARTIREIRVLPGYAKTPELFRKYNRPKRLKFAFSDGTVTSVDLADEPSLQRFPVETDAKSVKMTIEDVYRGTTRNETYVSEVEFGSAAAPQFEDSAALLTQASGSGTNAGAGKGTSASALGEREQGWQNQTPASIFGLSTAAIVLGLVAACGLLLVLVVLIVVLVILLVRKSHSQPTAPDAQSQPAPPVPPVPPPPSDAE